MIAIFDSATGTLEQVVEDTDGFDLTSKGTVTAPGNWQNTHDWDTTVRDFVPGAFLKERSAAKREINRRAESIYADYANGGIIGEKIQPEKHAQAIAYLKASKPSADDFPLLKAEVGITAKTIRGVAKLVEGKPAKSKSSLMTAAKTIEPQRLRARASVEAAQSLTEIASVLKELDF